MADPDGVSPSILARVMAAMLGFNAASATASPDNIAALANTPSEFVVADRSNASIQFLDVGRVLRMPDGTLAAHAYVVLKDARSAQGKSWTYGDLVVQYDCPHGLIVVRSGLLIGEDFAVVGPLPVPEGGRRWSAGDHADVAETYGYPELCETPGQGRQHFGKGESWRAIAALLLKQLRAH